MTKTYFAELKEKLGKFDPKLIDDLCNDRWASYEMFEAYRIIAKESAKEQHTKSSAIISELIDIIQSQSEALDEIYSFEKHCPETHYFMVLNKSLSETTTRLQKLRDGK